ncbi:MAG: hypothetical protein J0I20_24860, partial [Chloroflexi bacterium]|nr:hypothetical protein [Chloroflexota bacterium]
NLAVKRYSADNSEPAGACEDRPLRLFSFYIILYYIIVLYAFFLCLLLLFFFAYFTIYLKSLAPPEFTFLMPIFSKVLKTNPTRL